MGVTHGTSQETLFTWISSEAHLAVIIQEQILYTQGMCQFDGRVNNTLIKKIYCAWKGCSFFITIKNHFPHVMQRLELCF